MRALLNPSPMVRSAEPSGYCITHLIPRRFADSSSGLAPLSFLICVHLCSSVVDHTVSAAALSPTIVNTVCSRAISKIPRTFGCMLQSTSLLPRLRWI